MATPASTARLRGNPALRLAAMRRIHSYFGVFIAPSVLFLAFTGSLQLFSLHEAHGSYAPPPLIEKLGSLHKDQVFSAGPKPHRRPGEAHHAAGPPGEQHEKKPPATATVALKWLFLAVGVGLMTTTLLGLWIALVYNANKPLVWTLLILGAVAPAVLAAMT